MQKRLYPNRLLSAFLIAVLVFVSFSFYFTQRANASFLAGAKVALSDPRPSTSTTYTITFTSATNSVQCINVIFGNTVANINASANTTTAPTGMTTTSGTNGSISGAGLSAWGTGYFATNGIIQFEKGAGQAPNGGTITISVDTITNPSASTFYAQVNTYSTLSTHTCTGLTDSSNVMALVTTGGVATSVTVDPSISFSVQGTSGTVNGLTGINAITTGSSIAFGTVPPDTATSAAQLLTVSTNASGGYYLYVRQTQALTNSNNDTIAAQTPGTGYTDEAAFSYSSSGQGTSAFGYLTDSSVDAFTSDNYAALQATNTEIHKRTGVYNNDQVKVGYKLEIKSTQAPGTYSNVIIYTATPTY